MNIKKYCNKHLHVIIIISLVISISCLSSFTSPSSYYDLSFEQKDNKNSEDEDDDEEDKLVVKARIHLNNIDLENTTSIRVAAFINGEDIKQDIHVSSIDKTKKL